MKKFRFLSPFVACAALIGFGLVTPGKATASPLVTVTETGVGQFTLFNNSNNWFVFGFEIESPLPASGPSTTQPGWSAYTCVLTCNVSANRAFGYLMNEGIDPFTAGIAPSSSSSNFFFTGSGITDGTSNTIVFSEPRDIIIYAVAQVASIQDGTSNTIIFPENGAPSFPVRIGFRGITDGTSNTIFIGESLITPVPAALPLMGSILGLGLLIARLRNRRPRNAIKPA